MQVVRMPADTGAQSGCALAQPTGNNVKFIADGFQGLLARGLPRRVDHVDIDNEARQTGLELPD